MRNIEMTLPSFDEIYGNKFSNNCQLEYFKKNGPEVEATDFAETLCMSNTCFTSTIMKSSDSDGEPLVGVFYIRCGELNHYESQTTPLNYIRPMLKLSKSKFDEIINNYHKNDKPDIVFFGEYPQSFPILEESSKNNMQRDSFFDESGRIYLEEQFKKGNMKPTGRKYKIGTNDKCCWFQVGVGYEYEFNGRRYMIRKLTYSDTSWLSILEVLPLKWHVDRKNCLLISDKCIFSGLRIDSGCKSFERSEMYKFLNKVLLPDILQERKDEKINSLADELRQLKMALVQKKNNNHKKGR